VDDVLFFKIIVHFHGWNNAHHRGMRIEVTKFSTWGDDFHEIVTRTTWKREGTQKARYPTWFQHAPSHLALRIPTI